MLLPLPLTLTRPLTLRSPLALPWLSALLPSSCFLPHGPWPGGKVVAQATTTFAFVGSCHTASCHATERALQPSLVTEPKPRLLHLGPGILSPSPGTIPGTELRSEAAFLSHTHLLDRTQVESLREQYETGQEGWRAAMAERARKEVAEREAALRDRLTRERDEEIEVSETEHRVAGRLRAQC